MRYSTTLTLRFKPIQFALDRCFAVKLDVGALFYRLGAVILKYVLGFVFTPKGVGQAPRYREEKQRGLRDRQSWRPAGKSICW